MAGAGGPPVPGQGDVDGLLDQDPLVALLLELGLAGLERLVTAPPGLADPLAGVGLGGRRQGADLAVGQRERRAVAGVLEPDLLEGVEVGARPAMAASASSRARSTSSAFKGVTWTGS